MSCRFAFFIATFLITQTSSAQLFGPQQIISTQANWARSVYTADLDGDGDMDVLSASSYGADDKISWYENLSGGLFGPQQIISTQVDGAFSVRTADLDGDGDIDVLSASASDNKIAWYENLGGGLFGDQQIISNQAEGARSVHTADLDGDGDLDVLSASKDDDKIAWYENQGGGLFGDQQIISNLVDDAWSVYGVDLDGDGDVDVLSASSLDDKIAWYENQGGGIFGDQQIISIQAEAANTVYGADLDGDGDIDVLSASSWDGKIAWYENQGGGLFGNQQTISNQVEAAHAVYAADLDGDGDMDVLSASFNDDKTAWYENQGGGLFGDQQIISTQADAVNSVHTADLDGDGDMDVLSASSLDDKIAWYENQGGCTDPNACNYDSDAWIENNSCCYGTCGCIDPNALNFQESFDCEVECIYAISGTVFHDVNENGIQDDNELGLAGQEITISPEGVLLSTDDFGQYNVEINEGDQIIEVTSSQAFPFPTTENPLSINLPDSDLLEHNFGFSNEIQIYDLEVNLYPFANTFLCNSPFEYNIAITNQGNATINGVIELAYDSLFQGYNPITPVDSSTTDTVYMSFENLLPGQTEVFDIDLITPLVEFIGEDVTHYVNVHGYYLDEQVSFGLDSVQMEVACAYDPNDKQVFPEGYSEEHYIHSDTQLEYLVRFQNTGNAPATDVIVRDTLDENLNLSTFKLVANSHSVFTTVDPDTREVEFYFQDIMLPDSVNNEPESHGFVSFTVRPEAELPLLTELNNTAAIYFDNNPPIITNTTWSTIYDCSLFDVSFTDNGALLTASEGDHYQWFLDGEPIEGETGQEYTALENGNYSVQVDIDFPCSGTSSSTFIVTSIEEWEESEITLFPNPMTTSAMVDVGELNGQVQLEIYDIMGKLQRSEFISVESGKLSLERGTLSRGTYVLRLTVEDETKELKFLVE